MNNNDKYKLIKSIINNNYKFQDYNYIDNYEDIIDLKNNSKLIREYIDNNYKDLTLKEKELFTNKIIYNIDKYVYKYEKRKIEYKNYLNLEKAAKRIFKYIDKKIDFLDYNEKYKYIDSLIKYSCEAKNLEMVEEIINYFTAESEIQKQREIENKEIKEYQENIEKFESREEGPTADDLENYFKCLRHAIKSYDEKLFGNEYYFQIEGLNNFHKGLQFNFSIPKKELPHLLGIKNPDYDDDNNIILKLYNNHLKEYELIHNPDNYIEYVYSYLQNDLNRLISNNDTNKKELKDYLTKSFNKSLTFLKVYEYKRIPEIIIDYQLQSDYNITNSDDHTKDLITKAGFIGEQPKTTKLKDIPEEELTFENKKMIEKIFSQFGEEEEIFVKINTKTNKPDFKFIIIDDINYKYNKNKYWAELNPDIFIVSYDKELEHSYLNEKNGIISQYVNKAIKVLCAKLKKDLNINIVSREEITSVRKSDIMDKKRRNLINLQTIKNIVSSSITTKDKEKDFDIIVGAEKADSEYAKEDYNNLKMYMRSMLGMNSASVINNMFGIAEKYQEQPHIRMIQRIADKLMRKDKKELEKDVAIIGYGTARGKDGEFKEKFAKTLMGKTFLQLEYDLRVNGFSYKINGIRQRIGENTYIYSNYPLLMNDDNIYKQYKELLNTTKNELQNKQNDSRNR